MSTWDAIARARDSRNPQALVDKIPYARTMGISMALEDERLLGRMDFSEPLIGDPTVRALHGGTLGALLESTAIFTLLWEADSAQIPKTINLTVEYLRSGRAKTTFARADITRHGRRVANVHAIAWQDDPERPIAAAHAHFLLVPVEEGA